jgi:hypothetical protein
VRRREPTPDELAEEAPPKELLRFVPSQPSQIGPYGRPEPWRVKWTAGDFAAFLRARAAWRQNHGEPLPRLPARERAAMDCLGLPSPLVAAERTG